MFDGIDGLNLNITISNSDPIVTKKKKKKNFRQGKNKKKNNTIQRHKVIDGNKKTRTNADSNSSFDSDKKVLQKKDVSEPPIDDEIVELEKNEVKCKMDQKENINSVSVHKKTHKKPHEKMSLTHPPKETVPRSPLPSSPLPPSPVPRSPQPLGIATRKNPKAFPSNPLVTVSERDLESKYDCIYDNPLESKSSDKIFSHSTFEEMKLHPWTIDILKKPKSNGGMGYSRPTRVQQRSISAVLTGRDVMIKSETGSGKTLAYVLPVVHQMQAITPRIQRCDGTIGLILAPTRELCQQILEVLHFVLKPFNYIVAGHVTGGEKRKAEKARLRKGINLLVATPGRLLDHIEHTESFLFSKLQWMVFDEADRLLDMGFEKQITSIVEAVDQRQKIGERQNILVSATINQGVQRLASLSLRNTLSIDADEETVESNHFVTPHQLIQHFILVPLRARLSALSCFLRSKVMNGSCKIVVFFSTCDSVDFHYSIFSKTKWPSMRQKYSNRSVNSSIPSSNDGLFSSQGKLFKLHGNIPQMERTKSFNEFVQAKSGILLCTDVTARGVNLPTVEWIVQFDPPSETRDYVHRVGRTARNGERGNGLLFLLPSEVAYLDYLSKLNLKLLPLSFEKTICNAAKEGDFLKSKKKSFLDVILGELQFQFEENVKSDQSLTQLSSLAYSSFLRSYATHSSDTKQIFHVRGLHFGHVAKCFGLRDTPSTIKTPKEQPERIQKKTNHELKIHDRSENQNKDDRMKNKKRKLPDTFSEFAE